MTARRGLLLDFGGTLDADGVHWSTQLARAFAEAAGAELDRAALDRAFLAADAELEQDPAVAGFGLEAHVGVQARRMATAVGLPPPLADEAARRFVATARRHLARSRTLLAGARQTHGLRCALVSNFTPNLERIVLEEGLGAVLDSVVCSAKVGLRKPDPAIFRLALERLGIEAAEACAMIGDSLSSDIVPARALGLPTVWIRGDRVFVAADERAADHIVDSFAAALAVLGLGSGR